MRDVLPAGNARTLMVSMTLLAIAAAARGCAGNAHAAAPASRPTTAGALLSGLRMADATDLHRLERGEEQTYLSHKLQLARGGRIYFGQFETYDEDDHVRTSTPLIARLIKDRSGRETWRAIRIEDPRLHQASWPYVGAGPNRGEIWGVLDHATPDDDQPSLLLAHSTDGGETFALIEFAKPRASADFDSFSIGPDGKGRLTVYLSGEEASVSRPGYYHFRTSDGGKTWSKTPDYEPDAMNPAHEVPEDEQPDKPKDIVRPADLRADAGAGADR